MNLENYGYKSIDEVDTIGYTIARITAAHKDRFEIVTDYGAGFARVKASNYYVGEEKYPTTGDFVLVDYVENGDSRIVRTLPRKTFFSRLDPSPSGCTEQAVAANFDFVFIMQSLNSDFNISRLERYLALAWRSGAVPVIVLTKADLNADYEDNVAAAEKIAGTAEVVAISAKTGFGMDRLQKYMQPRTTIAFLGSSGVGKSSLVNTLAGEEVMSTGAIREADDKGHHTTTYRQLIMLKSGVMVIDTPGMRVLGMWDAESGLEQTFADVERFLGKCKFSDCRHENEPHCAIKQAIADGELSKARWESYKKLKDETESVAVTVAQIQRDKSRGNKEYMVNRRSKERFERNCRKKR